MIDMPTLFYSNGYMKNKNSRRQILTPNNKRVMSAFAYRFSANSLSMKSTQTFETVEH